MEMGVDLCGFKGEIRQMHGNHGLSVAINNDSKVKPPCSDIVFEN